MGFDLSSVSQIGWFLAMVHEMLSLSVKSLFVSFVSVVDKSFVLGAGS